jgi:hypothetical protein
MKRAKKWTSLALIITFAAGLLVMPTGSLPAAEAAEAGTGSMLVNGGFEQGSGGTVPGWQPDGSSTAVTVTEASYAAEGSRFLTVGDTSTTAVYGAVSDPLAASPFSNVVLNTKVRPQSGSGGKVDLRFYNSEDKLVSVVSGLVKGTAGAWTDLKVAASVPKDGASVRVAYYFLNEATGVFYADDARLSISPAPATITNLGPQSISLTVMTGSYGKDKTGRDVLYTVAQGDPGQFIVSDEVTKEVLQTYPLVAVDGSNVSAAWAITTASDGKVYIGSTPNGNLFQYDPMTEKVRALGKPVPTDTVIWVLVPGENGKVYGGSGYSQTLFEYDPATDRSKILASFKTSSKEQHVRSLAYDPDRKAIYVGGADVAKLYRYDLTTGAKTNLTPPEAAGKTSVYDLRYTAGKLFVRIDPGPTMYVYDPGTNQWLVKNNTSFNARGFSPVSSDGRVFYTYYQTMPDGKQQWSLYNYNVNTNVYSSLGVDVKGPAVSYDYIQLNTPDFPGDTLVGLAGNNGRAFYYNLQTGNVMTPELPLPPQFAELHNIGKGLDGSMLSAGFISGGGLGVYSPITGKTVRYPLLGQVEGYAALNGKQYFGVYPGASIFEYDPSTPWNRTDPSIPNNPLRLGALGNEQDRPVSMVGAQDLNKLFIATYPIAGKIGGALTVYDPITKAFTVKRNIVQDHSINSLLYRNGKLYMGTGAMNGGDGKLAVYDTATGQILSSIVPVAGKKAVTGLFWGPDGNIWGMSLGALFIYNPDTNQMIYSDDKFPTADYTYSNPRLMVGTDGNVYGSIFIGAVADKTYVSKMIKIDAKTKEVSILLESNVEKLAQDDFGNFYFKSGSELMKYSDPNLVLEKMEFSPDTLKTMTAGSMNQTVLQGVSGNGNRFPITGSVQYTSSNINVGDISSTGLITAKAIGTTVISAQYFNKQTSFELTVNAPTTLDIISSNTLPMGKSVVKAQLKEDGITPIANRTLTFNAGGIQASAQTDANGVAEVTLKLPSDQYTLNANFGGDVYYKPSSAASQTIYVFQPSQFVIWGGNSPNISDAVKAGQTYVFWGAKWADQVTGGDYEANASFKGYASNVSSNNWTASPGNSSNPPTSVAKYISVLVSTHISTAVSSITGNIAQVVILKVDNPDTYKPNPDYSGSGTLITVVQQ